KPTCLSVRIEVTSLCFCLSCPKHAAEATAPAPSAGLNAAEREARRAPFNCLFSALRPEKVHLNEPRDHPDGLRAGGKRRRWSETQRRLDGGHALRDRAPELDEGNFELAQLFD